MAFLARLGRLAQPLRDRGTNRPRPWRYGVAVAVTALSLVAALALDPVSRGVSFPLFLAAVMVSTWYGGLGAGLLATALGGLAIDYFFELPTYSLTITDLATVVDNVVFALTAFLISFLHARAQEARQRAEAARAEVEAAIRARDAILTIVSHDLKNPLTAILGRAEVLQRQVAAGAATGGGAAQRSVEGITDAARRMAKMIDELLDVAQLRMGQPLALDRRPADLVALVQRVVAEHAQTSGAHRLRVEAAVPALVGEWDGARLERVLANLLANAIRYSPRGGEIRVSVARQEGATGACAVLTVRDQGVGIPAPDLPRVFERFHRGGNVAGRIPGTGVGLATVQHIVQQHGGTITVESTEGAGATFTVRLPLAAGEAVRQEPVTAAAAVP
jgi:signal transduction histidine kinase